MSLDIDKMTRDELRAYAKRNTLAGYSKLNAPELREMVRKHYTRTMEKANTPGPQIPQEIVLPLDQVFPGYTEADARIAAHSLSMHPIVAVIDNFSAVMQQVVQQLADTFPLTPIEYDPWRPSAQAYADSRTPDRKMHLMRMV